VQLLSRYIPKEEPNLLPAKASSWTDSPEGASEREAIIRMLFKLKQEVDYLKEIVAKAGLDSASPAPVSAPALPPVQEPTTEWHQHEQASEVVMPNEDPEEQDFMEEEIPQNLSIREMSRELMEKVLKKHNGNRKLAASELGISERTLYRKIKKVNQE
jgi:DNA-binding NtrC family response regulator